MDSGCYFAFAAADSPGAVSRRLRNVLLVLLSLCGSGLLQQSVAGDRPPAAQSAAGKPAEAQSAVLFKEQVYPLLLRKCGACHGEDSQESRLRLDARSTTLAGGISGPAVVTGKPEDSLLYQRILGDGDLDRMPLDEEPLKAAQIEVIRRWIELGAVWPRDIGPEVTAPRQHWAFIPPRQPAVPEVKQTSWPHNRIDHFLLARMEQAGMAPSPRAGREQLIRRASLHLTGLPPSPAEIDNFLADSEPGAFARVVDRLLASPRYGERWAVPWLDAARYADSNGYQRDGRREAWPWRDWVVAALNADMPFDQFTIEQIAGDLLPEATLSQRVATGFHRNTMANVEAGTDPEEEHVLAILDRVNTTGTVWLGLSLECASCHNHKYDPISQREYYRLYAFFSGTEKEIETNGTERDFIGPKLQVPLSREQQEQRDHLQAELKQKQAEHTRLLATLDEQQRSWEQNLQLPSADGLALPEETLRIARLPADVRSEKEQQQLTDYFRSQSASLKQADEQLAELRKRVRQLEPPSTLIMKELPGERMARVFRRGDFLNPGEAVRPGTPAVLPPFPAVAPATRLGLARWLVDPANPLVARVIVNRQWAALFGQGLVRTPEDFGTQGERPTHPELLDWLAADFVRSGWSLKRLHRQIVLSAAWQQSSRITPELRKQDPTNRLLARMQRQRLPAELVRDHVLAVSGLLSQRMEGPPVFPYQPDGVWNHIGRASNLWLASTGTEKWRRGLYVNWRRTVPYPSFVNFDAPTREQCTVQRSQSSTPLQALTLMNDPAYMEAAVALAARLLNELPAEASDAHRVQLGFRLATGRRPSAVETKILVNRVQRERAEYVEDPQRAELLVKDFPVTGGHAPLALAPWVHVASVLLNLDETITRN